MWGQDDRSRCPHLINLTIRRASSPILRWGILCTCYFSTLSIPAKEIWNNNTRRTNYGWCYVTLCDNSPWKSCVELVYLTDYYREAKYSSSITVWKIIYPVLVHAAGDIPACQTIHDIWNSIKQELNVRTMRTNFLACAILSYYSMVKRL